MAQRPRLSQLKRTNINHRTFKEQYEKLELEARHQRAPVQTVGELPLTGNLPGSQCLVIDEGVIYYWDNLVQGWRSALGRAFELPKNGMRRYKRKYITEAGQTILGLDFLYNVGTDEIDIYIQGMLQDVDIDYYEVDERTIEFVQPLEAGLQITVATPIIVQDSLTVGTIQHRLEELEYNNYQLMMNQYYSGKPVDVRGLAFDGFLNTNFVDYIGTTANVTYDNIRQSMNLSGSLVRKLVEQFDNSNQVDPISTVRIEDSIMTLPISSIYSAALSDDFSTLDLVDQALTTAYHDQSKELFTTVDSYAGGDHYQDGDFMTTTGNATRVGFPGTISEVMYRRYYYSSSSITYSYYYPNQSPKCYSVLAMGSMTAILNAQAAVYRNAWPYSSGGHMYNGSTGNYRSDGYTQVSSSSGYYTYYAIGSLMPTEDSQYYRAFMTYVRSWNKIIGLRQYGETGGKYYQRLVSANGRTSNLTWAWYNRPTGLPNNVFGSQTSTFTGSSDYIDQIGATYDELMLRIGDKVYFLDSNMNVTKVLDWTQAKRKPSLYTVDARQFTADRRYLYFPARLNRNGVWGYYLEVFSLTTGEYVNEILVTRDNSGVPGTTAIGFDHDYNQLVLGQSGGEWNNLFGKGANSVEVETAYSGFVVIPPPNENERAVYSKIFTTNLPVVKYRLSATQVLNGGIIDYYVRFNDEAWTKINLNAAYTWKNPKGAGQATIQLRAVLKTTLNAVTSPILTDWRFEVCQYLKEGIFKAKSQLVNLENLIGGKIIATKDVPNESSMNWSIQLDMDGVPIPVAQDGSFSTMTGLDQSMVSITAELGTNNTLQSPVVSDFQLHFHQVSQGVFETIAFDQLEDISDTAVWVTTGSSYEFYKVSISRDGGETWLEAKRMEASKSPDGRVECRWDVRFNDNNVSRRSLKLRFELEGVTEIYQYGAILN